MIVVGDSGRRVHVKRLHYVAESTSERLDVILLFFTPFGTSILEPDLFFVAILI